MLPSKSDVRLPPSTIPCAEIEAVRRMVESPLKAEPHPLLKCGDRVRLCGGPLRGLEGILIGKTNVWKLLVSVEMLQRSAAVGSRSVDGRARLDPTTCVCASVLAHQRGATLAQFRSPMSINTLLFLTKGTTLTILLGLVIGLSFTTGLLLHAQESAAEVSNSKVFAAANAPGQQSATSGIPPSNSQTLSSAEYVLNPDVCLCYLSRAGESRRPAFLDQKLPDSQNSRKGAQSG
jgi:hypothetical protein